MKLHISSNLIVFFSLFVFSMPAIILTIANDGNVMNGFIVQHLSNMWLDIGIVILLSAFLLLITNHTRVCFVYHGNIKVNTLDWLAVIYVFIGCVCVCIINERVRPFYLINVNPASVGIVFSQVGVIKFYLMLYGFIIGVFWLLLRAGKVTNHPFRLRIFLHLLLFLFGVFLFVLTRREMLFLLIIIYVFYFRKFRFDFSIYTIISGVVIFFSITYLTFIFRGVEISTFSDFFKSQEFMPVQFGLLLIDRWVHEPYIGDLLQVFPLSFIFINMDYTSLNKLYLEMIFNFSSFGPTISFFPVILIYGGVPIIYFYFHVFILKFAEVNAKRNNSAMHAILFCFLFVRVLLFLRNGEMVNSLIELLFFVFLIMPFLFSMKNMTIEQA